MTDVVPGGKRRIDRVLDPEYLDGITDLSTSAIRHKRDESLAEHAELTRIGVLLDERIALVTTEQRRRAAASFGQGAAASFGQGAAPPVRDDTEADPEAEHAHASRLGRVFRLRSDVGAPPTHRRRRRVERLVADVDLADVTARTDDELARVLRTFRHERRQVTDVVAQVRTVVERCGDELGRRRVTREPRTPHWPGTQQAAVASRSGNDPELSPG